MTAAPVALSADVQLEHGYTRLANRLVEALALAEFTGMQRAIVLAIWRDTYGWNQEAVRLTLPDLAAKCGTAPNGGFRRALDELVREGVVRRIVESSKGISGTFMVEKDFTAWGRFSIAERKLAALWDQKPEHVAVRKVETPKPPKKPAAASWPARAVEIWAEEREGAVVAHGVVGKHLKAIVEQLGEAEALNRWTIYCQSTRGQTWANAAHFAAHHPEFSASPFGKVGQKPAATSMVR